MYSVSAPSTHLTFPRPCNLKFNGISPHNIFFKDKERYYKCSNEPGDRNNTDILMRIYRTTTIKPVEILKVNC